MSKKALLPGVRRQLGALSRLKNTLSVKAKLQLVNGLIISRLNYIVCLWGNSLASHLRKAQVCLNASARFILDEKKTTRQTELMRQCNWLNIVDRTKLQSLTQLWKVVRLKVPEFISEKITLEVEDTLFTENPRLSLTAEFWRCKSVRNWNNLPTYLRTELNLKRFKNGVKYLIDRRSGSLEPDR